MADSDANNNHFETNQNTSNSSNRIFGNNNRQDRGPPPMRYFRLSMNNAFGNNSENDSLHEPLLEEDADAMRDIEIQEGNEGESQSLLALINKRQLREYIRRMGNYLAYVTLLTMLIVIPIVTYPALNEHRADLAAFDSAGVMVLGVIILSLRLVYLHLTHWYMPDVQKYVVRILWMVPLYAVQSWLSLRYRHARIYISAARDLYEAYVIASFVYYLIELLGGQDALVFMLNGKREAENNNRNTNSDGNGNSITNSHHGLGHHAFPLNLVLGEEWELGIDFMLQCKHGVLQYVVVKTIATVLTFLFEWAKIYGEGEFTWNVAYPYLAFILNISVMYALYCLVMLFHAVNDELRHPIDWKPLGKFLCIKGVVFFTWWQGVVIFYLKSRGIIQHIGNWSGDDISNALINYCICVEMVFFSIAHSYSFSYKEYLPTRPEIISTIAAANAASAATSASENQPSQSNSTNGENSKTASINENDLDNSSSSLLSAATPQTSSRLVVPAILDRPMDFRDALWSSTVPKETIDDLHKFRNGVERLKSQSMSPGSISLQRVSSKDISAINSGDNIEETATASATDPDTIAVIDSSTTNGSVENSDSNNNYNNKSDDNDKNQDHYV